MAPRAFVPFVCTSVLFALVGCNDGELPPEGSYFDRRISPMLAGCVGGTTGCHLADDRGVAAGNLDVASYDSLRRRSDVLASYGPYPRSLLLLKGGGPVEITVETIDPPDPSRPDERFVRVQTDIRHAGGTLLDEGSLAFAELQRWLDAGFTRTGAPAEPAAESSGECAPGPGQAPGFTVGTEPAHAALFADFVADVQPILVERCGGSACHGASLADFHVSCGQTEAEQRWNFWISVQQLSDPPERSELLRRPLSASRGGAFHGGGDTFATADDPEYLAIEAWARDVARTAPALVGYDDVSDGYRFFNDRVQPVLVRKGCMAMSCHSPISLVFNLRGGAQGSFSRFARGRNYALSRRLLAIDSPDPNQSRIVAKNLLPDAMMPGGHGIVHRGGSLLEDFAGRSATPADCVGVDADGGDLNEIPAYCVLARWHAIEREEAIAAGAIDASPVRAVAWIARPLGLGGPTDFDTYRPGADLRVADATLDDTGAVGLGASRSVLAGCGLDPATADVRTPAASWDGARLAFAARSSATRPLRLYEVGVDGSGCAPIEGIAPPTDEADGILLHDLDPAFAPNGQLVFASTRGAAFGGPTRTAARLEPNADLYVFDPSDGSIRQLSFLLNQELAPAFMQDGHVIYTAEKRELDFHMLSLRRQLLDGGDYHPLYASRGSLGFGAATEVEQLPDQNFVFVAAPLDALEGAGSIAVFNRTIGPDQDDRDPGDRQYLHSLTLPARGAHHGGRGLFRSPSPLPTGRVLVACALDVTDVSTGAFDFDLCELEPRGGELRRIGGEPGVAESEVIAIGSRLDRGVVRSDGGGIDRPEIVPDATDAVVHFNDFPMIQTLMFVNTRTGRPIDDRLGGFEVLRNLPPPAGATRFEELGADVTTDAFGPFFARREVLGWVPLFDDGSTRMRVPGGLALSFRMTDDEGVPLEMADGMPLDGPAMQREHEQYYPGERIQRSIPRRFFNSVCGGCHGSISGRELDVGVSLDVITGASVNIARDVEPFDLMR